jgi:hypothetical protein
MDKKTRFNFSTLIFSSLILLSVIFFIIGCFDLSKDIYKPNYIYLGTIIDIEGGSSSNLIILNLDTVGKVPYTIGNHCINEIRIGQRVYKKGNSKYLWVKISEGDYC